jgi:hypothetical protein
MSFVCRVAAGIIFYFSFVILLTCCPVMADERLASLDKGSLWEGELPSTQSSVRSKNTADSLASSALTLPLVGNYGVKMAYGRTFGTCTSLDYATLEVNKPVKQYPLKTAYGAAVGELQLAVIASYVFYSGGVVERIKRLDFRDGYEVGSIPKGRIILPVGPLGLNTYMETGAGMSYVSETYRNSGSRFNWSLMGGLGWERTIQDRAAVSVGLQWRHLSNGNMWGCGDELHNSNSGTDMLQGIATFVKRF